MIIKRLSNVNWAAFLLSGIWGGMNGFKGWGNFWGVLLIPVVPAIFFGNTKSSVIALLIFYALTALIGAYLSLRGNRMILHKVKKDKANCDDENNQRVIEYARQRKQLIFGMFYRFYFFYGLLGALVLMSVTSPNFYFAMIAIDVAALTIVLIAALLFGKTENVLYSGSKLNADVIASIPMRRQDEDA